MATANLMHHRWRRSCQVLLLVSSVHLIGCHERTAKTVPPSTVKADESIVLYATYGSFDGPKNVWRCDIHGKVFEPEDNSAKRAAFVGLLRQLLDIDADSDEFLDDRVRPFLVDNERGKSVTIEIDGERYLAGTSEANGHFVQSLILAGKASTANVPQNQIVPTKAVLRKGDSRTFTGRLHLIPTQGVSLISDVDDTIKHSSVTDKVELLKNTFLRDFRAVEGMSELYSELAADEVAFHYVSGSPWQLFQPLEQFRSTTGFPEGTFHLKYFRPKDSSLFELLASQNATKLAAINPILDSFPDRRFLLIGDSGEQDPEIYGQIARQHPDQVIGIFIRNVTSEKADDARFGEAFANVPRDRWALFDDVTEISAQIKALAA